MRRTIFLATALTVCAAMPAMGQSAGAPAGAQGKDRAAVATAAKTTDTEFFKDAAQSGHAEVALAEFAQSNASSAAVKEYAARLKSDHEKANTELMSLAKSKKVTLPADMSAAQESTRRRLTGMTGTAFDRAYITQMVADHQKAVDLFTRASSSGDADVKAFASKTLPTLKSHLADAQSIQKTLR
jgi:putative membrane protein